MAALEPSAPTAAAPAPGTPTTEVPSAPPPSDWSTYVSIGGVAVLVLLALFAFLRARSRRRKELEEPGAKKLEARKERVEQALSKKAEAPRSPPRRERPAEKPVVESEAQLAARKAEQVAEAARLEAKRLVEEARKGKDEELARKAEEARAAAEEARQQAEAAKAQADTDERSRKEKEEEQKKAEYRAKKEREAEEKEQRRQQAEARQRAEEEEARQKKAAEEEAVRQAEEAQRQKIAAQSGKTLAEGLAKTRGGFMASLNSLFGRSKVVDESVLGELEEVLFAADIGLKTATALLDFARAKVKAKDLSDAEALKAAMRREVRRIVDVGGKKATDIGAARPYVVMVVGVNGSGKTTTIGKLAAQLTGQGKKVLLAAGDTFRAAATEQLEIWGQRANAPVVRGKEASDPGAVIFDALKKAQAEGFEVVLVDTAGRLHTKAPLMEELKRIKRVMEKALPGSPHEILLVLDSTNGQNAIAQARDFHAALGVQALVLTKLDGTAKGGVVIGICDDLKLPVRYVGIGEAVGDLKPFDPEEFVKALFD